MVLIEALQSARRTAARGTTAVVKSLPVKIRARKGKKRTGQKRAVPRAIEIRRRWWWQRAAAVAAPAPAVAAAPAALAAPAARKRKVVVDLRKKVALSFLRRRKMAARVRGLAHPKITVEVEGNLTATRRHQRTVVAAVGRRLVTEVGGLARGAGRGRGKIRVVTVGDIWGGLHMYMMYGR